MKIKNISAIPQAEHAKPTLLCLKAFVESHKHTLCDVFETDVNITERGRMIAIVKVKFDIPKDTATLLNWTPKK